jgi:hypothetical protein
VSCLGACTGIIHCAPFLLPDCGSHSMPIRLPSVDELLKAWKENPNALLIGMVFGFAAGYLVSWLVQINSVARAEFAKDRAEVSERKLEGEHGDLMAKLDASEKRFKGCERRSRSPQK